MKTYTEYAIKIEPFVEDVISGSLWALEPEGVLEDDKTSTITAYFTTETDQTSLENILNAFINEGLLKKYSISKQELEDKNWNEEWESQINVIKVSDKIVIKPTFRNYTPVGDEFVFVIDPKMSFGTGEHATTKLMLKMIEKHTPKDARVVDVGTGTGILAIAALKFGARNALAIDNDDWCLENIIENCQNNDVPEDLIDVRICELNDVEESHFDLILANIQRNVLLELCEEFNHRLASNGVLILSGLLFSDEKSILEKYLQYGFELIDKEQIDEWITLVFKR